MLETLFDDSATNGKQVNKISLFNSILAYVYQKMYSARKIAMIKPSLAYNIADYIGHVFSIIPKLFYKFHVHGESEKNMTGLSLIAIKYTF